MTAALPAGGATSLALLDRSVRSTGLRLGHS